MNARVFKHEENTLRGTPPFLYLNTATTVQVWAYWYLQEGKSQQWAKERKKKLCVFKYWLYDQSEFFKRQQRKTKSSVVRVCFPCGAKVCWA